MRLLFGLVGATLAVISSADATARTQTARVSPLLGVWRGDVVRINEGAIIGRNVMTLRIASARVDSMFSGELPRTPACTARFRIAKRLTRATWVAGIPRVPSGDGAQCVLAGFSDAYTKDAFKLVLLTNQRLRVLGLSHGVRVQATLSHPR